jgi:hypothetical protein
MVVISSRATQFNRSLAGPHGTIRELPMVSQSS